MQYGGVGANGLAVLWIWFKPDGAIAATHFGLQPVMETKMRAKPVLMWAVAWVSKVNSKFTYSLFSETFKKAMVLDCYPTSKNLRKVREKEH